MPVAQETPQKWPEIKQDLQRAWGQLTSDELERSRGDRKAIEGLIQQKYGQTQGYGKKISEIFDRFEPKANRTVAATANKRFDASASGAALGAGAVAGAATRPGSIEADGIMKDQSDRESGYGADAASSEGRSEGRSDRRSTTDEESEDQTTGEEGLRADTSKSRDDMSRPRRDNEEIEKEDEGEQDIV